MYVTMVLFFSIYLPINLLFNNTSFSASTGLQRQRKHSFLSYNITSTAQEVSTPRLDGSTRSAQPIQHTRKHSSKMSTVIRLFVKPRAIPGLFPATATHLWMNTRYWQSVQQRRMFVTEDSGESSELQPERKIKRVFPGEEAKVALICPT
jgi:hypothetical protein